MKTTLHPLVTEYTKAHPQFLYPPEVSAVKLAGKTAELSSLAQSLAPEKNFSEMERIAFEAISAAEQALSRTSNNALKSQLNGMQATAFSTLSMALGNQILELDFQQGSEKILRLAKLASEFASLGLGLQDKESTAFLQINYHAARIWEAKVLLYKSNYQAALVPTKDVVEDLKELASSDMGEKVLNNFSNAYYLRAKTLRKLGRPSEALPDATCAKKKAEEGLGSWPDSRSLLICKRAAEREIRFCEEACQLQR